MNISAEIRWFEEGDIKVELLSFFKKNSVIFLTEKPRIDWYYSNNDKSTSTKLRSDNIEIKRLIRSNNNVQVFPQVWGNIEQWIKYSISISKDDNDSMQIMEGKASYWIPVEKRRSVAKYVVNSNGNICQVSGEKQPAEGCTLEVCTLTINNQAWWTLCLEAAGSENSVQENLQIAIQHIFADAHDLFFLKADNSFGYPQWLVSMGIQSVNTTTSNFQDSKRLS